MIYIDRNNKIICANKVLENNNEIKKGLLRSNQINHGSVMFRRRCIEKVGFYREELNGAEDYDLWLRISEVFDIANIAEPLYKWRLNPNSVTFLTRYKSEGIAKLAIILSKERREYGKDALQDLPREEALNYVKNFVGNYINEIKIKNVDKRYLDGYFYWGRKLYYLNLYKGASSFLLRSMFKNPFNFTYEGWKMLIRGLYSSFFGK